MNTHFSNEDINAIDADSTNNYFTPVMRDVLNHIENPRRVCDLGCGNGVFTAVLKGWTSCQLVGVDGSEYALKQAKRLNFDELHKINDFSADHLPFKDNSFDLVINKDVLEHLLHPDHLVREIARITTYGGYALIHVPNHFPVAGRLKLLFNNTIDPFHYFPNSRRWDFPHIRFFTMQSLCEIFKKNDFQLIHDMNFYFFQAGRSTRFFPMSVRKILCDKFPDAWTEGYTLLFKRE